MKAKYNKMAGASQKLLMTTWLHLGLHLPSSEQLPAPPSSSSSPKGANIPSMCR